MPKRKFSGHHIGSWKEVRAAVFDQYGEQCMACGKQDGTIHVHHRYYEPGRKKWDYPLDSFEALCPRCHAKADIERRSLMMALGKLSSGERMQVLGYMQALSGEYGDNEDLEIKILSAEHAEGVADIFALEDGDVFELARPDYKVTIRALLGASKRRHHQFGREHQ